MAERTPQTVHGYFLGRERPDVEVPEGQMLVKDFGNPFKPQMQTGWKLIDAPPPEPDFFLPPGFEGQTLLTPGEYRDLQAERSRQTGIYRSQPTGDKDEG